MSKATNPEIGNHLTKRDSFSFVISVMIAFPFERPTRFRLMLADLHCRMRFWRRVGHTPDHVVSAARDFFVAMFF
jgi:hypothetical protein